MWRAHASPSRPRADGAHRQLRAREAGCRIESLVSELDQRIDTVSRTISSVGHALAGPLQSAMNTLFMARRTGSVQRTRAARRAPARGPTPAGRAHAAARGDALHRTTSGAAGVRARGGARCAGAARGAHQAAAGGGRGRTGCGAVGVAVAELAKNAFEAGAAHVELRVQRDGATVRVEVAGSGAWTTISPRPSILSHHQGQRAGAGAGRSPRQWPRRTADGWSSWLARTAWR